MWQVIGLCNVLCYGQNNNIYINISLEEVQVVGLYHTITMHGAQNKISVLYKLLAHPIFISLIFFTAYYSVR